MINDEGPSSVAKGAWCCLIAPLRLHLGVVNRTDAQTRISRSPLGLGCVKTQRLTSPCYFGGLRKKDSPRFCSVRVFMQPGSSASFGGRSVLVRLTPDRHRESGRAGTPASCQFQPIRSVTT